MTAKEARQRLKAISSPEAAKAAARFFKTGPGEYAKGDRFIGVKVPTLRALSREFRVMPLNEIESLLQSAIHEARHLALMILVLQAGSRDDAQRKGIFDLFVRNIRFINNWDLVDCSSPQIVGGFLMHRPRGLLSKLVKSSSLWERRIAIVSTQYFIRHGDLDETLSIAQKLLGDTEDLIHKAVGWTLREVGKRDQSILVQFLDERAPAMPRTMLRYAIEHFSAERRRDYLQKR